MKVLGIDIGGTGIKGAVVDTKAGVLKTDRLRLLTPRPATPDAVADVVATVVSHFDWDGPVGCTFPGVLKSGTIHTAANLDESWIGRDASDLFSKAAHCDFWTINDADAAGLAEARFGAARRPGVVLLLTLGTGIGSALMVDGVLVPNTELGHLPLHGGDAEKYASALVREEQELSYEDWAKRLDEYLDLVRSVIWPDLFVLGGGVSKHGERFIPLLRCETPVVAAELHNLAGIVGAALAGEGSAPAKDKKHKHKHK